MEQPQPTPWNVKSIDALRVLLCAYIVLFHALVQIHGSYRFGVLSQETAAIDIFFTLSGFGLMLSFLRSGQSFPGGLRSYFLRRAARLLPLYYACVGLSLASVAYASIPTDGSLLSRFNVVANALLFQNFLSDGVGAINQTYWFFAVKAQLYVLFPLLAFACVRFGRTFTVLCVAFGLYAVWTMTGGGLPYARPQLVALFLIGMVTAAIVAKARLRPISVHMYRSTSLVVFCASCVGFFWAHVNRNTDFVLPFAALTRDLSAGIGAGAFIVFTALPPRYARMHPLESAAWGALSPYVYAVYASHDVVFRYAYQFALPRIPLPPAYDLAVLIAVSAVPIAAVSVLLHVLFERPFSRIARG